MSDESTLELLEVYMDMVEKQDEIIYRMTELLREYSREIHHLRTINEFFEADNKLKQDEAILVECVEQYQGMKQEFES